MVKHVLLSSCEPKEENVARKNRGQCFFNYLTSFQVTMASGCR